MRLAQAAFISVVVSLHFSTGSGESRIPTGAYPTAKDLVKTVLGINSCCAEKRRAADELLKPMHSTLVMSPILSVRGCFLVYQTLEVGLFPILSNT